MRLSKWILTITMLVCSAMVWAKVNINTASLSELETLKGIGAKKAEKIVEYREKIGGFKSIDDLVNVSGIGTVTLNKIRDEITISDDNLVSNSKKTKVEVKEETSPKIQKDSKKEKLDKKEDITKKVSVETAEIKKDNKKLSKDKDEKKEDNSSKSSSSDKDDKNQSTISK